MHQKHCLWKSQIYALFSLNLEKFTPDRIFLHWHRLWCPWQIWCMPILMQTSAVFSFNQACVYCKQLHIFFLQVPCLILPDPFRIRNINCGIVAQWSTKISLAASEAKKPRSFHSRESDGSVSLSQICFKISFNAEPSVLEGWHFESYGDVIGW